MNSLVRFALISDFEVEIVNRKRKFYKKLSNLAGETLGVSLVIHDSFSVSFSLEIVIEFKIFIELFLSDLCVFTENRKTSNKRPKY